jgi:hypothetical protein
MKTISKLTWAKWIGGLLLAACLLPAANAQNLFKAKFTLREQVRFGQAVLPPGDYTIEQASAQTPAMATVRSSDEQKAWMVMAIQRGDSRSASAFLFLTGSGDQLHVQYLNLPELGLRLVYEPAAAPVPEVEIAKTQAVPVTLAKK